MRQYSLTLKQSVYYNIDIEADNILDAKEKVFELIDSGDIDLSYYVTCYDQLELFDVEVEIDDTQLNE